MNSEGINYILKYIKEKTVVLHFNNIWQYFNFYCTFDQISAAFVSLKCLKKIM